MMLGMAFWFSYQVLVDATSKCCCGNDVPNPFGGDVVMFLHLVPMTAALAMQPHLQPDYRTTRLGTLDFALLLVWWLYLYLFTVIPWQYVLPHEAAYNHNLNILYLTEKIVFLAGVGMLWARSQGSWRIIYANWFGASLTYSLSSYFANWAIERKIYYSGSLYDVAAGHLHGLDYGDWDFGVQFLRQATACPRCRWLWRVGGEAGNGRYFFTALFAAWSLFDGAMPQSVRTFRLVLTLASMLVMGGMVFFKQHLLDCELLRLLNDFAGIFWQPQASAGPIGAVGKTGISRSARGRRRS